MVKARFYYCTNVYSTSQKFGPTFSFNKNGELAPPFYWCCVSYIKKCLLIKPSRKAMKGLFS